MDLKLGLSSQYGGSMPLCSQNLVEFEAAVRPSTGGPFYPHLPEKIFEKY
jgi:hypothetical protein